jgi:hypothetical protein
MSGLNRREALILGSAAAAYGLARATPADAVAVEAGDEWAKIAAQQFMQLGVDLVKNEDDNPHGFRLGDKIDNRFMLMQRHVDWSDPVRYGEEPIKPDDRIISGALWALTRNVARSIGLTRKLKTFSLIMPKGGFYNGARLAYGHLRLRFLQSYEVRFDDEGVAKEAILNRIDILFPYQGV